MVAGSGSPVPSAALVTAGIIGLYFVLAILVSLASRRLARPLVAFGRRLPGKRAMALPRQRTLEGLIGSLITLLAVILAVLGTFSLFIDSERLIWIIGLFSAAFGLGARSLVADILAGMRFIFRNTFTIDEKVEFSIGTVTVEGIVEGVNVTNTLVRAQSGEEFVVPNGEIVVIRNFSRAPYSTARVRLFVKCEQLAPALAVLEAASQTSTTDLPDLIEPFQVLSTSDVMGSKVELTVIAHTSYAKAASLKLGLMTLLYQRLRMGGIEVLD